MIGQYKPEEFGKEYFRLKGSGQYPMFVAVALGIKPCMDEWIDIKDYDEFRSMCESYGLHVEPDVVFARPPKKDKVVGGRNITTTFVSGKRISECDEGDVHVMVAKSQEVALDAKRYGWYSVVIGNRSINKPFVDHLRFGKLLGFPGCCVDFFRRYNDWNRFSHPYETYKNTKRKPSYYCNNFLMDNSFFYIHHLPCSYSCEKTISYAREVEKRIEQVEPGFVRKTKEILQKPLLVFGERHYIIFDGDMKGDTISYDDAHYVSNPARPEEDVNFFDEIRQGDSILMKKDIAIRKEGKEIARFPNKKEWFMIQFS